MESLMNILYAGLFGIINAAVMVVAYVACQKIKKLFSKKKKDEDDHEAGA